MWMVMCSMFLGFILDWHYPLGKCEDSVKQLALDFFTAGGIYLE